jgi:intracellular septation protein
LRSVLSLWWSLSWRFVLALAVLFAISTTFNLFFFTQTHLGLQFLLTHDEFIFWRPTASSWVMAALLWVIAAAAPQFLSLVWGDRLRLDPAAWRAVGQALALFFVVLGLLNLAFWKLTSTEAWIDFKVFAPLPLLVAALALVSVALRRADRVP